MSLARGRHLDAARTQEIYAAATDDPPRFRYTCGWGGAEITARRPNITDEKWIALGAVPDDAAYAAGFQDLFGVDITRGFA